MCVLLTLLVTKTIVPLNSGYAILYQILVTISAWFVQETGLVRLAPRRCWMQWKIRQLCRRCQAWDWCDFAFRCFDHCFSSRNMFVHSVYMTK